MTKTTQDRRPLRRAGYLAFGAALTAVMVLVASSPASAHYVELRHGDNDYAGVFERHNGLWVEDGECDNHGVYAEYYLAPPNNTLYTLWDPNGCTSGIGVQYTNQPVDYVRLCENTQGCTGWRKS